MNIVLRENQMARVFVTIPVDQFEVYGGTKNGNFAVENTDVDNQVVVKIPAQGHKDCGVVRYEIFARNKTTNHEWLVLGGMVKTLDRESTLGDSSVTTPDYYMTVPISENGTVIHGTQIITGIKGERGYSAYEVACQQGFEGTEEEWFESIRQETATLAVEQVTPLMNRAEEAATNARNSETAAGDYAAGASRAEESAEEHAKDAAGSAAEARSYSLSAENHASDAATSMSIAIDSETAANNSAGVAQRAKEEAQAAAQETAQTKGEMEAIAAEFTATIPSAEAAARDMYDSHVRDWLLAKFGVEKYTYFRDRETNKIVIHTDQVPEEDLVSMRDIVENPVPQEAVVEQYNHTFEISWRDINKYAACTTAAEMKAVNADYKSDVLASGVWIYPIPSMVSGAWLFSGAENLKGFEADISHLTNIDGMFNQSGLNGEIVIRNSVVTQALNVLAGSNAKADYTHVTLDLPNATDITWICYHCCNFLQVVKGNLDKVEKADASFFGRYGTDYYSILDFQIPLPSLSNGGQLFNRQGLTKASVLLICDSIPTYTDGSTHPILLGIHKDLQADEEVLAAIETAKTKGWTVSVQWNGQWTTLPEAATTYSLRRPTAPPVYAMLKRDANGEFVDATNTRYMVDWCHELHSPDGKEPEAMGYTLFDSLDDALAEWGLTEIMEIPEEQ